jgi:hypothetical protein
MKEGRKEERKEGRKEGRKKGRKEERKEGRKEGRKLLKLYTEGIPPWIIKSADYLYKAAR